MRRACGARMCCTCSGQQLAADRHGRLLRYCGRHHWAIGRWQGKCRPARQDAGRPPREVGEGRWRHTDDPRASPIAANAIFYGPMIAGAGRLGVGERAGIGHRAHAAVSLGAVSARSGRAPKVGPSAAHRRRGSRSDDGSASRAHARVPPPAAGRSAACAAGSAPCAEPGPCGPSDRRSRAIFLGRRQHVSAPACSGAAASTIASRK